MLAYTACGTVLVPVGMPWLTVGTSALGVPVGWMGGEETGSTAVVGTGWSALGEGELGPGPIGVRVVRGPSGVGTVGVTGSVGAAG